MTPMSTATLPPGVGELGASSSRCDDSSSSRRTDPTSHIGRLDIGDWICRTNFSDGGIQLGITVWRWPLVCFPADDYLFNIAMSEHGWGEEG